MRVVVVIDGVCVFCEVLFELLKKRTELLLRLVVITVITHVICNWTVVIIVVISFITT